MVISAFVLEVLDYNNIENKDMLEMIQLHPSSHFQYSRFADKLVSSKSSILKPNATKKKDGFWCQEILCFEMPIKPNKADIFIWFFNTKQDTNILSEQAHLQFLFNNFLAESIKPFFWEHVFLRFSPKYILYLDIPIKT